MTKRFIRVPAAPKGPPLKLHRPYVLAQELGIDPSTLWRWRRAGLLPEPIRIAGTRVGGWTDAQVDELLKARSAR